MRKMSVLVFVVSLCFRAAAQSPQASLSGVVTDAQGGAIPAAAIAATATNTGVKTTVTSNEAGFYSMPNLPVGTYTLTVEKNGFRRSVRDNIVLSTGQSLGLDVQLEVGAVAESINVSDVASSIESRTSDVRQLIDSNSITNLPLGDRRTMNVINLTGAAVFVGYNTTGGQKANVSLAGGRTQSQMFWIDGGTGQNMRLGVPQMDLDPPIDAVAEIQVLSNNYSAQYGGSAGGVIVETTKSGTNEFHGTLFEYFRNNALDAPGFFAPVRDGKKVAPEVRYNVFGGTIGGPIRRNKTFFFFAYQGRPRRDGAVQTVVAPTTLQRAGDFSQTLTGGRVVPIYDPATTTTSGGTTTRLQFPGNVIPASRQDPVAVKAIQFYPLPNVAVNTAQGNIVTQLTANFYEGKVDHSFSDRDRLTGRFIYDQTNPTPTSIYPDQAADGANRTLSHVAIYHGAWTHIFGPTRVNDLRFEYGNRLNHTQVFGAGENYAAKLGLQGVPADAFPNFAPSGYGSLGSTGVERQQYPIVQHQLVDDYSWVRGKHALKFGGELRRSRNHEVNLPTPSGSFGFATQATGLPGNASSGNAIASMLLGVPNSYAQNRTDVLDRYSWYIAGFAQDDWKVSRALTLNFGLRWEADTPMRDSDNRFNGFDSGQINPVSGTPGVVKFMGVNGFRTNGYNPDWNNLAPRFGFAWKPLANTVVRGGYGIFYAHPFDSGVPNQASLGFSTSVSITSPDNGLSFPFHLRDGVPNVAPTKPVLDDTFGAVPVGKTTNTAVTFFDPSRRSGYAHQFNLGIQHQLPGSMIVEVSFLSNDGRKLSNSTVSINQILPGVLGPGHSAQVDRPYPQFSNVSIIAPSFAVSNYYAGMIRFEKRFSHGLNIVSSFTRSKFLDNSFESGSTLGNNGGPYSNYYNRRADYGYSANDVPNRFNFSGVYQLPFGAGRRWLTKGPARLIAGGWSFSTVTTIQSPPPFTVTAQTNTTNAFSAGALRPNVAHNPNLDNHTVARWFDTLAFTQPAIYQFGNEGVGILRGNGLRNVDLSVERIFQFKERYKVEFRAEAFNAFNHTNFGLPNASFGSPNFGIVTSAGGASTSAGAPRQIELGARIRF